MGDGFYDRLRAKRSDDQDLADSVAQAVRELAKAQPGGPPGLLLGKIQSGKTRAFIGVIAGAFDEGFGLAVVFTKGTRSLSMQTERRLRSDFADLISADELIVFDVMRPQGTLTPAERRRKIVIVAKKQVDNLDRVLRFFDDYPDLRERRVLVVDDEADQASIRFVRAAGIVEQGKISAKLDQLRRTVAGVAYLQVTATPYALYLQPETYGEGYVFKPRRPAFTVLLPVHSGYVGGDDFFGPAADGDARASIHVEVSAAEQDALRKSDGRRVPKGEELRSKNTQSLARAILTFALAASARRWQQARGGERQAKYAMVVHNDTKKTAHEWQCGLIGRIAGALVGAAAEDRPEFGDRFDTAFADLRASVAADHGEMPAPEEMRTATVFALREELKILKINSDEDVMALLDDRGELALRTACNVFVGGSILDRGITIPNLIAMYYGRSPKFTQADTALQHSRMYGARDRRDLAVTRFYTSPAIFDRLYRINSLENKLRQALESRAHDHGVVFITSGQSGIRPCAPNKILLSDVVAVGPGEMYSPTRFDVSPARAARAADAAIRQLIPAGCCGTREFAPVSRETAMQIIAAAQSALSVPAEAFDWSAMQSLFDHYAGGGSVLLLAEEGRMLSRRESGDKSGLSVIGGALRPIVTAPGRSAPALIVLRQERPQDAGGWASPFWWPLFAAPTKDAEPCVFAGKVATE